MATTPVTVYHDLAGISSPVLEIFPLDSGAIANGSGDALTVSSDYALGWETSVTEALDGVYRYVVTSSSVPVAWGFIGLQDDTSRYHGEYTRSAAEISLYAQTLGSVAESLDSMIESNVYTAPALANAPTGSGGGLDAAGMRAAIGMDSANLDDQLALLSTFDPATDEVDVGYVEGTDATDYFAALIATMASNVTTLVGKLTGITSLAHWLRLLGRSDTPDSTAKTEFNDGGGEYDEAVHSLMALRAGQTTATISVLGGDNPTVDGELFFVSEDDYYATENRAVAFSSEGWPDLTGATVTFRCKKAGRSTGTSGYFNSGSSSGENDYAEQALALTSVGGSEQTVTLELSSTLTNLQAGTYFVHIRAVLSNTHKITLLRAPTGMTVYPIVEDE